MNTKKQHCVLLLICKFNKTLFICCFMLLLNKSSFSQLIGSPNTIKLSMDIDQGELLIQWNTSKEINTSFFVVEKSDDSIHYEVVQTIRAASSSLFPKNYEASIIYNNRIKYYRVSLVLMDGSKILSQPISYRQEYLTQSKTR